MKKTFLIIFMIYMSPLAAQAAYHLKVTAKNYDELSRITHLMVNAKQTLLVVDDDDTLSMMPCTAFNDPAHCQFLGSASWFEWQNNLEQDNPDKVASNMQQLIETNSLVFDLSKMLYTDKNIPNILERFVEHGGHILVETARGPRADSATEQQFSSLKTNQGNLLSLFSQYSPKLSSYNEAFLGILPGCEEQQKKEVRNEKGIFYTAGQNKGEMLQCLLKNIPDAYKFRKIVFMDDTQKNVNDVFASYKTSHTSLYAVHFTGMDSIKKTFLDSPKATEYQAMATQDWKALNASIHKNINSPLIDDQNQT